MTNEQNPRGQGSPPQVGPVKAIVIKVLRGTIALLETAITKLEAPPSPSVDQKTSFPIPQAISNLPGWAKATVLATLAFVTVWGITVLFPGQPAAEVAQIPGATPPLDSEPITEITPTPAVEEPGYGETEEPGDAGTRTVEEVEEEAQEETEETEEPVSNIPSVPPAQDVPPSSASEELGEPELQLTPEQVLIAAIESQVQNVTSKLGNGLIRSIQADFVRSKLVVLLSNEWYNLTGDRQDQLASEMLVEARGLDFETLEITDSDRHLLARSPVVGSGMIILRRSLSPNT